MRGLIISQYFWPENFKINELAVELNKKFEIDVLTSYPNYPHGKLFEEFKKNRTRFSKYKGVNIIRIPQILRGRGNKLKISINYLSFLISSLIKILFIKKKYDFIFVFAPSPIFVALAGILLSRRQKSKLYIWVLDLWPEILKELKIINSRLLLKILDLVVTYIYQNCDKVFVQSDTFKKIISNKLKNKLRKRIVTIYSWSDKIGKSKFKFIKSKKNKSIKFLFTGNIGHSQNLILLLSVIKDIKKEKVSGFQFIIVGSGRKQKQIKNFVKNNNLSDIVILKDFISFKKLNKIIETCDVLYLSLIKGKYINSTIPAKFQTYLDYKKPILASIDGEVKKMIQDYKCGLVSLPDDKKQLKSNILRFINMSKNKKLYYSKNSFILSKNKFNKQKIISQLISEISN